MNDMCGGIGLLVGLAGLSVVAMAVPGQGKVRQVGPDETWEMRDGRFYQNGHWVFVRSGKFLDGLEHADAAERVIPIIDILVDKKDYNCFSLNIYPDRFDLDGDGRVDPARRRAYEGIARVIDHCWRRGVFCALSFETYNVGGGGVPQSLFDRHPDMVAINGLGEPARDTEYVVDLQGATRPIPSIFHPAYLKWSRGFMVNFLKGLGPERTSRLLYVETTVEPQYSGACNVGDKDPRRAALDFSVAAHRAHEKWNAGLSREDPRRDAVHWPTTQAERDVVIGHWVFNEFRGQALGEWVSGDIAAIRSVIPEVYIAVDYNGRFDDPLNLRVGDHDAFLEAIRGADIIQVAPHTPWPWGTASWNDVIRVNRRAGKGWAISEHMTVTGSWPQDDGQLTRILDNTLVRGTRWGWDMVKIANTFPADGFSLYREDWSSPVLDVIEGPNWDKWLVKIGAARFVPKPRPMSGPRPIADWQTE